VQSFCVAVYGCLRNILFAIYYGYEVYDYREVLKVEPSTESRTEKV